MRLSLIVTALAIAGAAHADPCRAIPDRGPAPTWLRKGATFTGPVAYVGDGDSLCVAAIRGRERDPATWVEVRVADFFAPELHEPAGPAAKALLERVAKGRVISCRADHRSYDRMVATCRLDGRSLGDRLRAAGEREAGRGWRP